eukprot:4719052-Alexandrium_andersonii.AAC.1
MVKKHLHATLRTRAALCCCTSWCAPRATAICITACSTSLVRMCMLRRDIFEDDFTMASADVGGSRDTSCEKRETEQPSSALHVLPLTHTSSSVLHHQ